MTTTHKIDAVTPRTGRERLKITDGDALGLSSINRIVGRIEHRDAIDKHVLGVRYLYATKGMVKDTASHDAYILGPIDNQSGFDDRTWGKIDGAVGGNLYFLARQVFGAMHARAEVDETCVLHKDILSIRGLPADSLRFVGAVMLRQHGIGKEMQIVYPVAIKLNA